MAESEDAMLERMAYMCLLNEHGALASRHIKAGVTSCT